MYTFKIHIFKFDEPLEIGKEIEAKEILPVQLEMGEIISSVPDIYEPHITIQGSSEEIFLD